MALLLAALLCVAALAGCSNLRENHDTDDLPPLPQSEEFVVEKLRVIKPVLYFPHRTTRQLTGEVREITLAAGQRAGIHLVEEFLSGPAGKDLLPVGQGCSLEDLELTGQVANVYLTSNGLTFSEEWRFLLAASLSDSLIEYCKVTYVSVFFDGSVLSVGGYPTGPLTRTDGDVMALYRDYVNRYAGEQDESQMADVETALYFLDRDRQFILPEVRKVDMSGVKAGDTEGLVRRLLEELAQGSRYDYALNTCLDQESLQRGFTNVVYNPATRQITLHLPVGSFANRQTMSPSGNENLAMIYYTLAGLLPDIQRLVVAMGDYTGVITRRTAAEKLGSTIELCFPAAEGNSLVALNRVVREEESDLPSTYIRELVKGIHSHDADKARDLFPYGFTEQDVLGVDLGSTVATVDFSANILYVWEQLSPDDRTLLVYSITNTLTRSGFARSVRLSSGGALIEDASGTLSLGEAFLENPGLMG